MSDAPKPRQLPFWLTASVMLNLALVGLILGLLINRGERRPPKPFEPGEERVFKSGHEDRRVVGSIIREAFSEAEDELKARRAAGKALGEALAADPLDMAEVRKAATTMREADTALHDALDAALFPRLETLTVEQRAMFAKALARDRGEIVRDRRRGDRPRKWRKGDRPGDRPPPPPPPEE